MESVPHAQPDDRPKLTDRRTTARRWARPAVGGVAVVLVLAVSIGVTALGIRPTADLKPSALPSSSTGATRTSTPTIAPLTGGTRVIEAPEHGVQLTVPGGWERDPGESVVVRITGTSPAESLSVYHGTPALMMLCDPVCGTVDLTTYLPASPAGTLRDVATIVSARTGTADWRPATGVSPRIVDARRLDVVTGSPPVRRTYLIGSYLTEILVAVASVKEDAQAASRIDSLVTSILPFPGRMEPVGVPIRHSRPDAGMEISIPDIWPLDGLGRGPTLSFGDGRVTVSAANATGHLAVCDPGCRSVAVPDLASLERATFAPDGPGVTVGNVELSAWPGRYQRVAGADVPGTYRAIAIVDGTPIHLWIDLSRDVVDPELVSEIAASLEFLRPTPTVSRDGRITGRGFELALPTFWQGAWNDRRRGSITVASGDDTGRLWSCRWSDYGSSAIPCSIVQADTLSALVAEMHIPAKQETISLDGEPAIVQRIATYEYPARGGQWLAFVLAVHDGRPYVIRLHNREREALALDEVIEGFRFVD